MEKILLDHCRFLRAEQLSQMLLHNFRGDKKAQSCLDEMLERQAYILALLKTRHNGHVELSTLGQLLVLPFADLKAEWKGFVEDRAKKSTDSKATTAKLEDVLATAKIATKTQSGILKGANCLPFMLTTYGRNSSEGALLAEGTKDSLLIARTAARILLQIESSGESLKETGKKIDQAFARDNFSATIFMPELATPPTSIDYEIATKARNFLEIIFAGIRIKPALAKNETVANGIAAAENLALKSLLISAEKFEAQKDANGEVRGIAEALTTKLSSFHAKFARAQAENLKSINPRAELETIATAARLCIGECLKRSRSDALGFVHTAPSKTFQNGAATPHALALGRAA